MYLWVLTLVTLFEPTLVAQLSHSFQMTYMLEVASNSIALWYLQNFFMAILGVPSSEPKEPQCSCDMK